MGSGLIYAVIIGGWVAYFIPLWLRRHEERSEARSVDRFADAMRVLSGRNAQSGDESPAPQVIPAPAIPEPSMRAPRKPVGRGSRAARSLAIRRRRILASLLLLSLLAGVGTPLTAVPWFLGALPACVLLGYLVHLRLQARRSRELSRTRKSIRRRALGRLRRFDSAEQLFLARRTLREERSNSGGRADVAVRTAPDDGATDPAAWQPVPVPLPTYVTKPVAPRPAQAAPMAAKAEQPFDQSVSNSNRESVFEDPDAMEHLPQRRAVND